MLFTAPLETFARSFSLFLHIFLRALLWDDKVFFVAVCEVNLLLLCELNKFSALLLPSNIARSIIYILYVYTLCVMMCNGILCVYFNNGNMRYCRFMKCLPAFSRSFHILFCTHSIRCMVLRILVLYPLCMQKNGDSVIDDIGVFPLFFSAAHLNALLCAN